jgi:hypothetical protein
MPRSRLPNLLKKYATRGIRNQSRPLKRILMNEIGRGKLYPTSLKAR